MKTNWQTILIIFIFPSILIAQFPMQYSLFERNTVIEIDSLRQSYSLPDSFLIQESEQLFLDSLKLESNVDYRLNYTKGEILFRKPSPSCS